MNSSDRDGLGISKSGSGKVFQNRLTLPPNFDFNGEKGC
jgi:hypothetical protein